MINPINPPQVGDGSPPERLFTVVTAAYNCAAKLDATAQSVLSQLGSSGEYIVVDGGSTDGTLDCLRSYGPQIRWLSEPDDGIYDAMNKGIGMARGRFLYFLGAGDRLRPRVLAKVAERVTAAPVGPSLFYGDVHCQSGKGSVGGGRFNKAKLCRANICHQAIFYDRRLFERFGSYETAYHAAADWVFNMRCFGDPSVRKIYLPLIVADYEGGGVSERADDLRFSADQRRLKREHLGRLSVLRERGISQLLWLWSLRRYVSRPHLALDRLAGRRSP